jgi:hypothetical protein
VSTAEKIDWDAAGRKWAENMRAAQPMIAQRRVGTAQVAARNRAEGAKHPCGIKGCTRHSFKGPLCRLHYSMVPWRDKMQLTMDCWDAQFKVASKHRRRFLRELQARLDADA